jgi:serine/threonine protein kinase
VKLGEDTESGRKVAVKIIKPNMDEETFFLLKSEIEALSHIKHQNVIELIEQGQGEYIKASG